MDIFFRKNFTINITFAYLLIVVVTIILYSQVATFEFINFDDDIYVLLNPYVQKGITLQGIKWAFTSGYEGNWIPLSRLSHMLDVEIFGMNAGIHHLVNVGFHVANTLLLFSFLYRTTNAIWRSLAVALLFAVHPLHIESVAWVAERKDVLSAFFWMLSLCTYAAYAKTTSIGRYLLVLLCFALGILAKPMTITLPLILLLLDFWPLRRWSNVIGHSPSSFHLLVEKLPFIVLAACSSFVTYLVQDSIGSITNTTSFFDRLLSALVMYVRYLTKMLWPTNLAIIYPKSLVAVPVVEVATASIVIVAITLVGVWQIWRRPYVLIGWLWYVISITPVIGLVGIGRHSMADRYTYLPLIGIFIILVWSAAEIVQRLRTGNAPAVICFYCVILSLVTVSWLQIRYWKNSITLFSHAIEVTENNWVAHNNLGNAFLEKNDFREALFEFSEVVRINPRCSEGYFNQGVLYGQLGDHVAAIKAFEKAFLLNKNSDDSRFNIGIQYLNLGKVDLAISELNYLQATESKYAQRLSENIRIYVETYRH